MNFLKKHKKVVIICTIVLIIFLLLFLFLKIFMADVKADEYGNRLEGIDKVEISPDVISKMKDELKSLDEIEDVSYRLQGRLIYVSLEIKDGASIDTAKEVSSKILEYFDDEEKAYYDIQVLVTSSNKESTDYPFMGYKHKTESAIVW